MHIVHRNYEFYDYFKPKTKEFDDSDMLGALGYVAVGLDTRKYRLTLRSGFASSVFSSM